MTRSKYSAELRSLILASNEPGLHLAERIGVNHQTISKVRRGERWRESVAGSSVFSMKVA